MRIYELEDGKTDVTEEVIALLEAWGKSEEEPPYKGQGICGNLMNSPPSIGGCAQICNVFKELGYEGSTYLLGRPEEADNASNLWEGGTGIRRRKLCLEAASYLRSNL